MLLKHLRGLPVIDPTTARKVGTVRDYQVDPGAGSIAALDIDPVQAGDAQRIPAQRVRRVGRDAVILTGDAAASLAPASVNERWLDDGTLVGLEVIGDDGNRVGRLMDGHFDQDTLAIQAYLLVSGLLARLIRRGGRVLPASVHSCSREFMLLSTGRVSEVASPVAPVAAVAAEPTQPLSLPRKPEDRLPAPTYEPVADAQTVTANT